MVTNSYTTGAAFKTISMLFWDVLDLTDGEAVMDNLRSDIIMQHNTNSHFEVHEGVMIHYKLVNIYY